MDVKHSSPSMTKNFEKTNVRNLVMVDVPQYLSNLLMAKMNIQKNGADILTIQVVNVDETIKNNNKILRVCKLIMKKN